MILTLFSCACWPSVCRLWRNFSLGLLPIFCLVVCFYHWVVFLVYIFWKLSPSDYSHLCFNTVVYYRIHAQLVFSDWMLPHGPCHLVPLGSLDPVTSIAFRFLSSLMVIHTVKFSPTEKSSQTALQGLWSSSHKIFSQYWWEANFLDHPHVGK